MNGSHVSAHGARGKKASRDRTPESGVRSTQAPETARSVPPPAPEGGHTTEASTGGDRRAEWEAYLELQEAVDRDLAADPDCEVGADGTENARLIDLLHLGFGDFNVDFASSALNAIGIQALAMKNYIETQCMDHVLFSMAMDISARALAAAALNARINRARQTAAEDAQKNEVTS